MLLLINVVFALIFWNACTIAADEGRTGWAWTYLIVSAWNGASALSSIF
jgi:hypothetical protein